MNNVYPVTSTRRKGAERGRGLPSPYETCTRILNSLTSKIAILMYVAIFSVLGNAFAQKTYESKSSFPAVQNTFRTTSTTIANSGGTSVQNGVLCFQQTFNYTSNASTQAGYDGTIFKFVIPNGVTSVTIEAWGAEGQTAAGSLIPAGRGAYQKATFNVSSCQTLWVLPGGKPGGSFPNYGDGGGGSFVTTGVGVVTSTALLVAGGGGGSGNASSGTISVNQPGGANSNGQCSTSGGNATQDGFGGTNGSGGNSAVNPGANSAGAGGGFLSAGMNGSGIILGGAVGGFSFAQFASGTFPQGGGAIAGGFGGGGGGTSTGTTGGGGGGYSGGGGGDMNNGIGGTGGGGGSFVDPSGTSVVCNNTTLANIGNGMVRISYCYTCPTSVSISNNITNTQASTASTCQAAGGLFTLTAIPAQDYKNTGNGQCPTAASNNNGSFEYSFQWFQDGNPMAGQTSRTLTLSKTLSGTHTYTVFVDCSAGTGPISQPVTITVNPMPSASFGGLATNTVCTGGTASQTVNVCNTTGGPFTVQIIPSTGNPFNVSGTGSSTTFNVTPSQTTTYSIGTVTDNTTGCTGGTSTFCSGGTATTTVTVSSGPPAANIPSPAPVCQGSTLIINAQISVNNPGTYSWQWFKNGVPVCGGTASSCSNACGGLFSNTQGTQVFPFPGNLVMDLTDYNVCGSDGGQYWVQVTSNAFGSCMTSTSNVVTVVVNQLPTATFAPTSQLICNGSSNNCQTVNFTGTPPFTLTYQRVFDANGSVTTTTVSGITGTSTCITIPTNTQGTYTYSVIQVSDANCVNNVNNPSTATDVVTGPFSITSSVTQIQCNSGTGSVTLTPTGGINTITYTLTGTGTGAPQTKQGGFNTPVTFTGLGAGSFTVTAVNGNTAACVATATFVINPGPSAVVINSAGTTTAVACTAGTTSVVVRASGGTGSLTYSLDGGPQSAPQPNGATYTITGSNVGAGTHTITARDANGCTSSIFTLTVLPPSPVQVTGTPGVNSLSCKGGTTIIVANATGGANGTTYRYVLTGGPGSPINSGAGQGGTYTFTNVPAAGCWQVTATDVNGCTGTSTCITVTEPANALTGTVTRTNTTCSSSSDGTITVTATGGTPTSTTCANNTYFVNFNGGAYQPFCGSGGTIGGFLPGTYTVTIKDGLNCVTSLGSVTITAPPAITANVTSTSINCNNGTATVTISSLAGGNQSLPITYTISGIMANGQPLGPASQIVFTTSDFVWPTGIPAGTYSITASQSNCPSQAIGNNLTPVGNLVIGQPNPLTVTRSFPALTCNNSTTTVTFGVSGGNGTVTVQFINANTSNQMPGSPQTLTRLSNGAGPVTATFTNVPAGTYNWVVTDNNGCQVVSSTNPNTQVIVNPPSNVTINSSSTVNNNCNGGQSGSFTVNASGGTGSLTYVLAVPNGSTYAGNRTVTTNSGTAVFSGLPAGTYTVTVSDAAGCGGTTTTTIVTQPNPVFPINFNTGAQQTVPDLLINVVSIQPSGAFPTTASCVTITYSVQIKNNNGANLAATGVIVRITKLSDVYTLNLTPASAANWTQITDNPGFKEFQLNPGLELSCGGTPINLSVTECRNGDPTKSTGSPITASVRLPGAVQDSNGFDNARASTFNLQ